MKRRKDDEKEKREACQLASSVGKNSFSQVKTDFLPNKIQPVRMGIENITIWRMVLNS